MKRTKSLLWCVYCLLLQALIQPSTPINLYKILPLKNKVILPNTLSSINLNSNGGGNRILPDTTAGGSIISSNNVTTTDKNELIMTINNKITDDILLKTMVNSTDEITPTSTSTLQLSLELIQMRDRLEKLEKGLNKGNSLNLGIGTLNSGNTLGAVNNLIDSFSFNTLELNAKTIEICATLSFFVIGVILGASLLDRLWLIGGIVMSYWANGAVYKDTRMGAIARKIGVQFAQIIKDLQEKYNQTIIFYRTGKLGYHTMGIWERYDNRFAVSKRMEALKKITMKRASDFNSLFSDSKVTTRWKDIYQVILDVPTEAKKYDSKFGITTKVNTFLKSIYTSSKSGLKELIGRGSTEQVNENNNQASSNESKVSLPKIKSLAKLSKPKQVVTSSNILSNIRNFASHYLTGIDVIKGSNNIYQPKLKGRCINPWSPVFSKTQGIKEEVEKVERREKRDKWLQWVGLR